MNRLGLVLLSGCMGLGCGAELGRGGAPGAPGAGDEGDSPDTTLATEGSADPQVASAMVGHKALVTAQSGLHLRTGPSTSNAILLTIPFGGEVDVLAASGGWNQVTYSAHTGWASAAYLETETSGGGGGSGGGGTAIDQAIARAQSGVGFSYRWGGGCWNPGSTAFGACFGTCPSCTHSGTWGADCSGYMAKVWQVPSTSSLSTCDHPYTTSSFRNTQAHWSPVSRSSARRGDALVHYDNGAGHIFLFESGDPWSWMTVYEAKGCSYGIVHDTRMAGSTYIAIRRDGF